MRTRFSIVLTSTMVLLLSLYLLPIGLSANYSGMFQLKEHPEDSTSYRLNVAVSRSLQDYYREKSHGTSSESDFAKFVTPYTLKPIANCLGKIYSNDEDFANGVLMIVHQIPYEITTPSKYPVETIVENKGDCDLFSYVAASVIKAGGLDVVLFYYESEAHMSIGVNLAQPPSDARGNAYYVTSNNIRYYIAECTGGNWENGWRVGECPDELRQATVQVVSLENCEQTAPGQVAASYKVLTPSTITLAISQFSAIQGSVINLYGNISPTLRDKTVTIYVKANGSPWTSLVEVRTDSNGQFTYAWIPETGGINYIRASWSGDSDYAGADSPTQTMTVLSTLFVALIGITAILAATGTVIFLLSRRTQQETRAPQPPETPS